MRLLMLDNEFPPLGGGMGTANEALLRYCARHTRLEIDVITAEPAGRFRMQQFSERIRLIKVPVRNQNIHHSTTHELLTYTALSLPLALQYQRRRPYNLCLAWSTVPAGWAALQVYRRTGLPYLLWISGPDIPGFEQRYRAIYPLLMPFLRSTWRNAARVIVKCAWEGDMIHKLLPGIALEHIPNGVNLAAFVPGDPVPDDGPLRIICVGRLIERKGQQHLLAAVQRLIQDGLDVQLSLVGTGDSLAAYQALAHRLGITERVHFVGYVPREAIAAHYAAAHVFVLPSYNEGMSIATLEAMGAGLAVVVSRTGGTEDMVVEGVNGLLFDWADTATLTAHLRRLATDRALARRMGAASRQRALAFDWGAASRQFVALFEQYAADTPAADRPDQKGGEH